MNLEHLINIYLEHCSIQNNLSFKTLKAYNSDLSQFKEFMNDNDFLDKSNLEDYIAYLKSMSYKIKTIKRKIASLKAFFSFLTYQEYIEFNPFYKIKVKIKESFVLPKIITIEELNKLFNVIEENIEITNNSKYAYKELLRDRAILELLLASGMRIGELCALKRSDIMYSSNLIKINGKGSKERMIPIYHPRLIDDLLAYEKAFDEELKCSEYFFISKRKNRISCQSVAYMIKKYSRLAGIGINITPHMFRHTFATMLLEQDVDSRQIQLILGHSSIYTTQIYTHISSKKKNDIMKYKNPLSKIY